MYDPYENKNTEQNRQAPANPDGQTPVTPSYGYTNVPESGAPGTGVPGTGTAGASQTTGGVTYHTGPVTAGQAYLPRQNAQPQQQPAAYTWNQPSQPAAPYYRPAQPQKPKKKKGGKFFLKLLVAVLCCAVVSMGSVGVFALMIQNGVVNVESQGDSNTTAAFTIYKQAESDKNTTPTVTGETLTAQEAAKKVTPSVVCVQNYQISQQGSFYWNYDEDESTGVSPAGEGSGIIITDDGYILTNQHVVDGATSLKVVTSEGLTYEAELVGEDTQTDLAVIKVTTEDELTPAEFGSSDDLEVGDEVLAIGNPGGLQFNSSVTFGRVSALNRKVENSETGYSMACIQTDAAINPGNSGGALVDLEGHVVGINSSKIVATGYEGLGFAIPSDTAQPIVSDLIEYGYVKDRPTIGFDGQYIDGLTASFFGMSAGYYVTQVTSEEAQQAGLQRGDMVVAIDDTQITSEATISTYIAEKKPGDTVTLTLERNGKQGTLELALAENTGKSDSDTVQNTWK